MEGHIQNSQNWKKEKDGNETNKKKKSNSRKNNKETNKTMAKEELLENDRQEYS